MILFCMNVLDAFDRFVHVALPLSWLVRAATVWMQAKSQDSVFSKITSEHCSSGSSFPAPSDSRQHRSPASGVTAWHRCVLEGRENRKQQTQRNSQTIIYVSRKCT